MIFGNSCYKFVTVKKNWHEAMKFCETDGANLVAMESASENTFLQTYIRTDNHLKVSGHGNQIQLYSAFMKRMVNFANLYFYLPN